MTIKIEQVLVLSSSPDIEDGGCAMIAEGDVETGNDPHFFLRFQSWDEDLRTHPTLNSLLGKRLRITIEEIPEETELDRIAKVARRQIEEENTRLKRDWILSKDSDKKED